MAYILVSWRVPSWRCLFALLYGVKVRFFGNGNNDRALRDDFSTYVDGYFLGELPNLVGLIGFIIVVIGVLSEAFVSSRHSHASNIKEKKDGKKSDGQRL